MCAGVVAGAAALAGAAPLAGAGVAPGRLAAAVLWPVAGRFLEGGPEVELVELDDDEDEEVEVLRPVSFLMPLVSEVHMRLRRRSSACCRSSEGEDRAALGDLERLGGSC